MSMNGPGEAEWKRRGAGVRYVIVAGQAIGAVALQDEIRGDSRQAVDRLHQLGVRVGMITGDARQVAEAVTGDLGIDQADVGIAIGAGTDVAIESAGIVLASDDPRGAVAIRRLSQVGYRKMIQNLA